MWLDDKARVRGQARVLATLALAFSCLYLVTGDDGAPGGPLFALLVIYVTAYAGGNVTGRCGLPPLLGMLVVGLVLRNAPVLGEHVGSQVDPRISSAIRLGALALILTRAGLAFDIAALRRLLFVVARLAALPCLSEAIVVFLLAVWLLDFSPAWAAMLGFVVAPISPAVVVPSLLSLQDRGFGTSTGIPTMVVAAAPLDDVLSIAGFGICLGFGAAGSSSTDEWLTYARAPLELVLGLGVGALGAAALAVLCPAAEAAVGAAEAASAVNADGASVQSRLTLLLGTAVTAAFGLKKAGFSGASALSVLVLAAGAARAWGPTGAKPLSTQLAVAWNSIAQPLLFGLVGSAVALDALQPRVIGLGLVILGCSLLVRCSVAFIAVGGRGLRWQERLFTALAWMPKATVQAAIGAIALDEATSEEQRRMGRDILAVAVLAILATAPAGAVAISALGPRLLVREGMDEEEAGKDEEAARAPASGPHQQPQKIQPATAVLGRPSPGDGATVANSGRLAEGAAVMGDESRQVAGGPVEKDERPKRKGSGSCPQLLASLCRL